MSSLQDRMLGFIDEQLTSITQRPGMWGPNIAVELQVLQLLELRSVVLRPALEASNPRAVLDAYEAFIARKFPNQPPLALASILEKTNQNSNFGPILDEFKCELISRMLPEQGMDSHDLVLRIWLHPDIKIPRASTLSKYYEVFRKVLRAVSRSHGTRGRAEKGLEEAIDFALSDISITPANGAPSHIVLPLDQLGSHSASDLEGGIRRIVMINEWAADDKRPISVLVEQMNGQELAQRVAAQTLRLIPGSEEAIEAVELGGKLTGRKQPIQMKPVYAQRMVSVVKQGPDLGKFDEIGSVRAVDMDRRSIRLRLYRADRVSRTLQCWTEDVYLLDIARMALGDERQVRVKGSLYREGRSTEMVIVRDLELLP